MRTLFFLAVMVIGIEASAQSPKDISKSQIFSFVDYIGKGTEDIMFKEDKNLKLLGVYFSEKGRKIFLIKADTSVYKQEYIEVIYVGNIFILKSYPSHPDLQKMDEVELKTIKLVFLLKK